MKAKRDITLGEMQDECKRRQELEFPCDQCGYRSICVMCSHGFIQRDFVLTDPPRFSDEAMAVMKVFMALGATHVQQLEWTSFYKRDMDAMPLEKFVSVGSIFEKSDLLRGLEPTKIYDIAELLGDETDAK